MMAKKGHEEEMTFPPLLSKEEKESLLDKKIAEMRRKNAAKEKRFREVEADKKAFESTMPQKIESPSPTTQKQPHANGVSGGAKTRLGVGRGRRLEKMSKQKLHAPEYEAKKQHQQQLQQQHQPQHQPQQHQQQHQQHQHHQQHHQQQQEEANPDNGPPPDPGYRFLSDPSREGPFSRDPQKPPDYAYRRHPRNFGGDTDFEAIPSKVKQEKEKQSRQQLQAPRSERDKELQMTGRERRNYSDWKSERQKIDQDRIDRHRKATGEWKREWDSNKQDQGFKDRPVPPESQHTEPGRRPAGRIGSGRFDRGVRDEPRPVRVLTDGQTAQKEQRDPYVGGDTGGADRQVQWSPRRRPLSRDFDDVSELDTEYKDGNPRKRVSLHGNSERPPLKSRLSQGSDDGRSVEEHNDSLIINVVLDSRTGFVSRPDGQRTPEAVGKNTYSDGRTTASSPASSPRKLRLKRPERRLKNRDPRPRDPAQHEDATNWRKSAKGVHFEDWPSTQVEPEVKSRETLTQRGNGRDEQRSWRQEGRRDEVSRASPDTGDAHAWAERKTKAAQQKTQRRRRRSTNEDSGSDVHNSSAESLERFIEENTLHLDVHMDLPSLIPPEPYSSPENIIKTPVGFEHVLDWSSVTPDDEIDVSEVVYGKRSPQEKYRGRSGMDNGRQSRNRGEHGNDSASRKRREGQIEGHGSVVDREASKHQNENDAKIVDLSQPECPTAVSSHAVSGDPSSVGCSTLKASSDNGKVDNEDTGLSCDATEVAVAVLSQVVEDAVAASSKVAEEDNATSSVTGDIVTDSLTEQTNVVAETPVNEATDDVAAKNEEEEVAAKDDMNEVAAKDDKEEVAAKDDMNELAAKDDKEEVDAKDDVNEVAAKDDKEEVATKDDKEEVAAKNDKEEVAAKNDKEEVAAKDDKEEVAAKEEKEEVAPKDDKKEVVAIDEKDREAAKDEKEKVAAKDDKEEVAAKDDKEEVATKDDKEEVAAKDDKEEVAAKEEKEEVAAKNNKEEVDSKDEKEEEDAKDEKEEVAAKDEKEEEAAKDEKEEVSAKDEKEEVAAKVEKEEVAAEDKKEEVAAKDEQEEVAANDEKEHVAANH